MLSRLRSERAVRIRLDSEMPRVCDSFVYAADGFHRQFSLSFHPVQRRPVSTWLYIGSDPIPTCASSLEISRPTLYLDKSFELRDVRVPTSEPTRERILSKGGDPFFSRHIIRLAISFARGSGRFTEPPRGTTARGHGKRKATIKHEHSTSKARTLTLTTTVRLPRRYNPTRTQPPITTNTRISQRRREFCKREV